MPPRPPVLFVPEPFPAEAFAALPAEAEIRQGRAGEPYSEAEWRALLPDVDALVVTSRERLTAAVLAAGPRLKVVAKAGARPSNLDFAAAEKLGIAVTWTPGANAASVAEMTLGLMLTAARRLDREAARLLAGGWRSYEALGLELAGSTVGLVGLGAIGRQVARRLLAFDTRVLGYDPYVAPLPAGVTPCGLEALLEQSDLVSLHCDLNAETAGLIGEAALSRLRPGAILVNTARGGLVDEAALLRGLAAGRPAVAALDVFAAEPLPRGSPLLGHPAVIATPHVSAFTRQAILRECSWALEDALLLLGGSPARHAAPA